MNKKISTLIVVVLVIILGVYLFWSKPSQAPVILENNEEVNQKTDNMPKGEELLKNQVIHEVIYTNEGYSPKEITIKLGETVLWKNQSSGGSWVGSALHPTHVIYSRTSLEEHCPDAENVTFDECKSSQPGESWSFTFNKIGTWRYHNHVKSSYFGVVIVQ